MNSRARYVPSASSHMPGHSEWSRVSEVQAINGFATKGCVRWNELRENGDQSEPTSLQHKLWQVNHMSII